MAIKSFKPYSASRRFMTVSTFEDITASKPEKSLLVKVTNKGGRNNSGRMTVRHQGGGHKRRYRLIDFKRIKDNIPAKVATIEYDRTALPTSPFCSMQTAKRNTSSLRTALRSATSFTAARNRISRSATLCRSRTSPSVLSYTTLK